MKTALHLAVLGDNEKFSGFCADLSAWTKSGQIALL